MYCNCFIELADIYSTHSSRALYNTSYHIFLSLSLLFVFFQLCFLIALFSLTSKTLHSPRYPILKLLVNGLNTKKQVYVTIYFTHYLLLRVLLGSLIFLSVLVPSQYVWLGLIFAQFMFMLLHLVKLYDSVMTYLMVLLREIQILFVFIFLGVLQFVDQSQESLQQRH